MHSQVNYAIRCIKHALKKDLAAIEPTRAAQDLYASNLRGSFKGTVWKSGCDAWYLNKDRDVSDDLFFFYTMMNKHSFCLRA